MNETSLALFAGAACGVLATFLLLLTGDRLVLLDSGGRQVRDWPVAVGTIDSGNTWLSTSAGHVLLFGPTGMMRGVAG